MSEQLSTGGMSPMTDGKPGEESLYELNQIPMARPCMIYSAVPALDQGALLEYMGSADPFARDALVPVVHAAAEHGAVRTVRARVPTKGVQRFVDLASFQREFDRFVEMLREGRVALSPDDLRAMMAGGRRNNSLKRRLLSVVKSTPWLHGLSQRVTQLLLPLAERFCATPEEYARLAALTLFRPSQIRGEICALLRLLAGRPPHSVLEIGTNRGGTFYLFARHAAPDARLLTVDLHLQNEAIIRSFGRGKQRVELLAGDSTAPETIAAIRSYFPGGIDFVLLDGDHSYEGIRQDFENYAPLVKPGGLIAFHDIVEDNETRHGVITGGWAGGVPRFWREIREQYEHVEFVNDPLQDGLGIGVLFVPEKG